MKQRLLLVLRWSAAGCTVRASASPSCAVQRADDVVVVVVDVDMQADPSWMT